MEIVLILINWNWERETFFVCSFSQLLLVFCLFELHSSSNLLLFRFLHWRIATDGAFNLILVLFIFAYAEKTFPRSEGFFPCCTTQAKYSLCKICCYEGISMQNAHKWFTDCFNISSNIHRKCSTTINVCAGDDDAPDGASCLWYSIQTLDDRFHCLCVMYIFALNNIVLCFLHRSFVWLTPDDHYAYNTHTIYTYLYRTIKWANT